jgi:hypothetical protein
VIKNFMEKKLIISFEAKQAASKNKKIHGGRPVGR